TGGRYFRATDTTSLQDIYALLDELEPVEEPESGFRPVKSYYYWPLGAAFALVGLLGLAGLLQRVVLRHRVEVRAHAG
ncbi:MAG: BatB protein, partial [Gammaproteobacteria bacterium]|nr:BatB protein [Gammaproteobacteria bacterium]